MIGPAFISAPDSASPQGSITPGNARADHIERMIGSFQRKHADRQPLGADGDGDFERAMLARQPGQRAGFGESDGGMIAGVVRGLGENHRAERRRRQEHHLAVAQMRRELRRDVVLRESRGRAQDQFGAADGFGDIGRHQRELHVVAAVGILDDDARARGAMRGHRGGIAPPQPHLMALQRKIARRRERAVAAAEHRDLHIVFPPAISLQFRKCCTLPSAVRGRSSTKTISRGTLKRASCVSTCAFNASASTRQPARRIT